MIRKWENYHGDIHRLWPLGKKGGLLLFIWKYCGQYIPTMGIYIGQNWHFEIGHLFHNGYGLWIATPVCLVEWCWYGKIGWWLKGNVTIRILNKYLIRPVAIL